MNTRENNLLKPFTRWSLVAVAAAALVACGGGGGGGGSDTPPAQVLVDAPAITQGFWSGTVTSGPDGATRASAVITPDLTAWVALETGAGVVGVARVPLSATATNETSASIAGTGSYYSLDGDADDGAAQALSATGTVTASSLAATTTGAAGGSSVSLTPTTTPSYATAASQGDIGGSTWQGTVGGGAAVITWRPDATGTLAVGTSTSSTGCTYAGTVRPHANPVAVYTVNVVEDCAGAQRTLSGIATLNAAKTRLNVVFTSDAGTRGGLFALTKQ